MSIALHKQQMLVLVILAFLTIVALSFTVFSAVAHIDMWHMLLSGTLLPDFMNGRG